MDIKVIFSTHSSVSELYLLVRGHPKINKDGEAIETTGGLTRAASHCARAREKPNLVAVIAQTSSRLRQDLGEVFKALK